MYIFFFHYIPKSRYSLVGNHITISGDIMYHTAERINTEIINFFCMFIDSLDILEIDIHAVIDRIVLLQFSLDESIQMLSTKIIDPAFIILC